MRLKHKKYAYVTIYYLVYSKFLAVKQRGSGDMPDSKVDNSKYKIEYIFEQELLNYLYNTFDETELQGSIDIYLSNKKYKGYLPKFTEAELQAAIKNFNAKYFNTISVTQNKNPSFFKSIYALACLRFSFNNLPAENTSKQKQFLCDSLCENLIIVSVLAITTKKSLKHLLHNTTQLNAARKKIYMQMFKIANWAQETWYYEKIYDYICQGNDAAAKDILDSHFIINNEDKISLENINNLLQVFIDKMTLPITDFILEKLAHFICNIYLNYHTQQDTITMIQNLSSALAIFSSYNKKLLAHRLPGEDVTASSKGKLLCTSILTKYLENNINNPTVLTQTLISFISINRNKDTAHKLLNKLGPSTNLLQILPALIDACIYSRNLPMLNVLIEKEQDFCMQYLHDNNLFITYNKLTQDKNNFLTNYVLTQFPAVNMEQNAHMHYLGALITCSQIQQKKSYNFDPIILNNYEDELEEFLKNIAKNLDQLTGKTIRFAIINYEHSISGELRIGENQEIDGIILDSIQSNYSDNIQSNCSDNDHLFYPGIYTVNVLQHIKTYLPLANIYLPKFGTRQNSDNECGFFALHDLKRYYTVSKYLPKEHTDIYEYLKTTAQTVTIGMSDAGEFKAQVADMPLYFLLPAQTRKLLTEKIPSRSDAEQSQPINKRGLLPKAAAERHFYLDANDGKTKNGRIKHKIKKIKKLNDDYLIQCPEWQDIYKSIYQFSLSHFINQYTEKGNATSTLDHFAEYLVPPSNVADNILITKHHSYMYNLVKSYLTIMHAWISSNTVNLVQFIKVRFCSTPICTQAKHIISYMNQYLTKIPITKETSTLSTNSDDITPINNNVNNIIIHKASG